VYPDYETIDGIVRDLLAFTAALPRSKVPLLRGHLRNWNFQPERNRFLQRLMALFAKHFLNNGGGDVLMHATNAIDRCANIPLNEHRPRLEEAIRFLTGDNEN